MTETKTIHRRRVRSDRVKTESPAYKIVDKFGGLAAFCRDCDFAASTVQGWLMKGLIPANWRGDTSYARWIIRCGERIGVVVDPADFIED